MVKVSLVVAVFNPGSNIDELLLSIDRQSLPPEEFEVIFADDDSTDGSRERLQGWADSRPHVRVLHNSPNSGWPGRPRNLAIDVAQGEYLFFADNDDKLSERSLEWMYDYAVENDADVVMAKEVGIGRGINRTAFRRNVPDARLGRDPLLALLTPHKLVRTSMVREHGIRFPEGRVRLEDHYFIISCYVVARRISILADKPCYYWTRRRGDGRNASSAAYDPVVYFRAVERAMQVVEAHIEPGPLRDQLYAHWYERKMLNALRGFTFLRKHEKYQESLVRELRRVSDRFDLGRAQWPWMGAPARLRSHVLAHGTIEQLRALGAAEPTIASTVEVEELRWSDDDQLRLCVRTQLVADGRPVPIVREGATTYWDTSVLQVDFPLPLIEIGDLLPSVDIGVLMVDRMSVDVDFLDGVAEPIDGDILAARTEVAIDPRRLIEVHGSGVIGDLRVWTEGAGWGADQRLPAKHLPEPRIVDGLLVRPYSTRGTDNLSLQITRPNALAAAADSAFSLDRWSSRMTPFIARARRRAAQVVAGQGVR